MTAAPTPAAGTTCTVDVLGAAVAISPPASLRSELRAALVNLEPTTAADRKLTLAASVRGGWSSATTGAWSARALDPAVTMATVIWRLNAIATESPAHMPLHAACVAHIGEARPARRWFRRRQVDPGGGVPRRRVRLLSDELAAIDCRTGMVVPHAKPLAVRAAGAGDDGGDLSHLVDAALDTLDTGAGEPPARSPVAATIDRLVRSSLRAASAQRS
jgi:hypothetical protein